MAAIILCILSVLSSAVYPMSYIQVVHPMPCIQCCASSTVLCFQCLTSSVVASSAVHPVPCVQCKAFSAMCNAIVPNIVTNVMEIRPMSFIFLYSAFRKHITTVSKYLYHNYYKNALFFFIVFLSAENDPLKPL